MKIYYTIFILALEILGIFCLNRIISKRKGMFLVLLTSFLVFVIGLWIKRFDFIIDYRLLLIPLIQTGLISFCHIIYQLVFKIPFYINMRGFEYPKELKTDVSGFIEFLSGFLSIGILIVTMILFFVI
jgi:hypothetical protein